MSIVVLPADGTVLSDTVRNKGLVFGKALPARTSQRVLTFKGYTFVIKRVGRNIAVFVKQAPKLFVRAVPAAHPGWPSMPVTCPITAAETPTSGSFTLVPNTALGKANGFFDDAPVCVGHNYHGVVVDAAWDASVGFYPPNEPVYSVVAYDAFTREPPTKVFPATYSYAVGTSTSSNDFTNLVNHVPIDTYGDPCTLVAQNGWQYVTGVFYDSWNNLDVVLGVNTLSLVTQNYAELVADPENYQPLVNQVAGCALYGGDYAVVVQWVSTTLTRVKTHLYVVGYDDNQQLVQKAEFVADPLDYTVYFVRDYLLVSLDPTVEAVTYFNGVFVALIRDTATGAYSIGGDLTGFNSYWAAHETTPNISSAPAASAFSGVLKSRFYYNQGLAWTSGVAQPSGSPYTVEKMFCSPDVSGAQILDRRDLDNFLLTADGLVSSRDLAVVGSSQYVFSKYANYLNP